MDLRKLFFWQRWLLHSFLLWLVITITAIFGHWYKRYGWEYSDWPAANDPITVSAVWHKLVDYNLHQGAPLLILVILLLIEVNNQYLFNKKTPLFLAGSIVTGLLGALLLVLNKWLISGYRMSPITEPAAVIAGYAFVYPLLLQFVNKRIFRAERLYEQTHAELRALKAQVNPHFLFNMLNTLYGTALIEGSSRTAAGIERLSALMRYALMETDASYVPLKHELRFLEEYIQLQRMRLSSIQNSTVTTNIIYDEQFAVIAPLLLIPFIENAFKYGVSNDRESYIHLALTITNGQLSLKIKNKIIHQNAGAGTGIKNAKKRLALLYPGRHWLEIASTPNDFSVLLQLQVKEG